MSSNLSATIIDFRDHAENVQRRQLREATEELQRLLIELRQDAQLIAKIQQLSELTSLRPLETRPEYVAVLTDLTSQLEEIAKAISGLRCRKPET